jgi:hypothetical protein
MKFFIPFANTDELQKHTYEAIKKWNAEQLGFSVVDRKILSISYLANSEKYTSTVGEPEARSGEIVIAILETSGPHLICTENRGVIRGEGIMVGDVIAVTEFERG